MTAERVAAREQIIAQLAPVVDFSVEYDADLTSRVMHRLVPGRGQIEDGQTAVTETDRPVATHPLPVIVRAPVPLYDEHVPKDRPCSDLNPRAAKKTSDTTHAKTRALSTEAQADIRLRRP
jgi:hypothetical protein